VVYSNLVQVNVASALSIIIDVTPKIISPYPGSTVVTITGHVAIDGSPQPNQPVDLWYSNLHPGGRHAWLMTPAFATTDANGDFSVVMTVGVQDALDPGAQFVVSINETAAPPF